MEKKEKEVKEGEEEKVEKKVKVYGDPYAEIEF